jgi:hypothetical protein
MLSIAQFAICQDEQAGQSDDSAATAVDPPVVRWTANRDEMNFRYDVLENVETTTLHRGTPEMGTFNHHAHITHFKSVFYAIWDTQARDEHGPGQHGLLRRSADQGKTWSPVEELFPALDQYVRSSEALLDGRYQGRIQTSNGFAVVDDVLYAVTEVDDHRGTSIGNRKRFFAGRLCRSINPHGTLGDMFWLKKDPPEPVEGFPAYPVGDPELVTKIKRYFQQPGNEIQLDFSAPVPESDTSTDAWTPFPISDDNHRLIEQVPSYRAANGTWVRLYRDAGLRGVPIPDKGFKTALEARTHSQRVLTSLSWLHPGRMSGIKEQERNDHVKPTSVDSPHGHGLAGFQPDRQPVAGLRPGSARPNGRPKISLGRHHNAIARRRVASVPLRNYG